MAARSFPSAGTSCVRIKLSKLIITITGIKTSFCDLLEHQFLWRYLSPNPHFNLGRSCPSELCTDGPWTHILPWKRAEDSCFLFRETSVNVSSEFSSYSVKVCTTSSCKLSYLSWQEEGGDPLLPVLNSQPSSQPVSPITILILLHNFNLLLQLDLFKYFRYRKGHNALAALYCTTLQQVYCRMIWVWIFPDW